MEPLELAELEADAGFVQMPGGLLLPESLAEERIKKLRRPRAFDLFCGCGGFSLGFMQAGFEVVGAVDNDPTAAITYTMNLGAHPMQFHFLEPSDRLRLEKALTRGFKRADKDQRPFEFATTGSGWISDQPHVPGVGHFWLGDITKLTGREILKTLGLERGELDCVIGSPPCQGFSKANRNAGPNDPRNELVFEWARLVCELAPKSCCMENVPGIVDMVTHDGLPLMDVLTQVLTDGDFAAMDALRRSLKAQLGVAFVSSRKRTPKGQKKTPRKARGK